MSSPAGECGVHIAAGLGRLEMLQVLVAHGANLGIMDQQGDSAVYWASRQGHAKVVKYLVEQGVHVNKQNKVISTVFVPVLSCSRLTGYVRLGPQPAIRLRWFATWAVAATGSKG